MSRLTSPMGPPLTACYEIDPAQPQVASNLAGYAISLTTNHAFLARSKGNPARHYWGWFRGRPGPKRYAQLIRLTVERTVAVPGYPSWELAELHGPDQAACFPAGYVCKAKAERLLAVGLVAGLPSNNVIRNDEEATRASNQRSGLVMLPEDWSEGPILLLGDFGNSVLGFQVGKGADQAWWPEPLPERPLPGSQSYQPDKSQPAASHGSWKKLDYKLFKGWPGFLWAEHEGQFLVAMQIQQGRFWIPKSPHIPVGPEVRLRFTSFSGPVEGIKVPAAPISVLASNAVTQTDGSVVLEGPWPPGSACVRMKNFSSGKIRVLCIDSNRLQSVEASLPWFRTRTLPDQGDLYGIRCMPPTNSTPFAVVNLQGELCGILPPRFDKLPAQLGKNFLASSLDQFDLPLKSALQPSLAAVLHRESVTGLTYDERPKKINIPSHVAPLTGQTIRWMCPLLTGSVLVNENDQLVLLSPEGERRKIEVKRNTIYSYIFWDAVDLPGPDLLLAWKRQEPPRGNARAAIRQGVSRVNEEQARFVSSVVLQGKADARLGLIPNSDHSIVGVMDFSKGNKYPFSFVDTTTMQNLKTMAGIQSRYTTSNLAFDPERSNWYRLEDGNMMLALTDIQAGTWEKLFSPTTHQVILDHKFTSHIDRLTCDHTHVRKGGHLRAEVLASMEKPRAVIYEPDLQTPSHLVPLEYIPRDLQSVELPLGPNLIYTDGSNVTIITSQELATYQIDGELQLIEEARKELAEERVGPIWIQ